MTREFCETDRLPVLSAWRVVNKFCLPAAFLCSCACVCAGRAAASPSVWARVRKWAGWHVALCHLGPRVPITDGPLTLAQAWGQLRHHTESKREFRDILRRKDEKTTARYSLMRAVPRSLAGVEVRSLAGLANLGQILQNEYKRSDRKSGRNLMWR